jgi:hypothetical protein
MLATNAGLLTPVLGDPSPWNPQRLYINGEAGAWYDPGDLTAEKVAWRRNLLTWSEQFDNAAWSKSAVTVVANNVVAPDGTTTADTITDTALNGDHYAENTTPNIVYESGVTYTISSYFKNVSLGYAFLGISKGVNAYASVEFDLVNGAINRTSVVGTGWSLVSSNAVSVGSGWYRCLATIRIGASAGEDRDFFGLSNGSGAFDSRGRPNYAGTLQSVAFWGAMVNPGAVESYQRITDFTSDFLAAFPTHALYQDAAGTTPVTALGQPVGLALDKSRGALNSIGTTVLTNGDFASGTGWTAGTGWSIAAGVATKTAGTASVLSQAVTLTIPGTYRLVYTMTRSAGTLTPRITGGTTVNATARSASGTYTEYVTTVTGNTTFEFSADASFAGTVDDVALQLVPGVHKIQPTSASREALDARVNLLTYSEQFDNAAWTKASSTITANAAVAPNGTMTADKLVANSGTVTARVEQSVATAVTPYRVSLYAKAAEFSWIWFRPDNSPAPVIWFDVANGAVGTADALWTDRVVENVGNGWFRISATLTGFSPTTVMRFGVSSVNGSTTVVGNGTDGILLWGADLRLATDAAYPYQRVVTATDYADVGAPRSFLHDGFDDSSFTASSLDLSGTDKVTVWAGVYKNSDANGAILAELSADSNVNNGSFYLTAPSDTGAAGNFGLQIGGTARTLIKSGTVLAPVSRVYTGTSDISTPSAALRLNGVQAASTTASLGTGNFGNYVFFIGRRNNASNPFNGKIYCIIIRGGVTDAATLALTERYVGSRMGIVL